MTGDKNYERAKAELLAVRDRLTSMTDERRTIDALEDILISKDASIAAQGEVIDALRRQIGSQRESIELLRGIVKTFMPDATFGADGALA
jgi:signal recognition particle GTPase